MEDLIRRIAQDHPGLLFSPGHSHCWSPAQGAISYAKEERNHDIEALLHEVGHARLGHEGYTSDLELLQKEVEAWHEAECLAELYDIALSPEHVQDCLDTYRDWLYKRSLCPTCLATGVQESPRQYVCLNCSYTWSVTDSRFRRPYRRAAAQK